MEIILITFIVSIICGGCLVYLLLRPRLQVVQELDKETLEQNRNIQLQNEELLNITSQLKNEKEQLILQKETTQEQLNGLNNTISAMEAQAEEAADLFYKSKMQLAEERLSKALEEAENNYSMQIADFVANYESVIKTLNEEQDELNNQVALMRSKTNAAVEAAKRAEEMKTQQDFYKIQLSELDEHEIELLKEVEVYLRNKEPLNKVIWKCYYEKPVSDLIGRVVGSGPHTGIYKITEIESGKCYVGQAANIADRWKQHIKRGLGAETPTRNKLYPAMNAIGPQNFTFEVIEECERALLDEREDYWQEYFKAKEFGYSIK